MTLFVILLLAYLNSIPNFVSSVPYYDKVGHFFLFGVFAYVAHRASGRKYVWGLPLAFTLFTIFTVAEECLQMFSNNRTFSGLDLLFSLSGIWFFFLLDYTFVKMHNKIS